MRPREGILTCGYFMLAYCFPRGIIEINKSKGDLLAVCLAIDFPNLHKITPYVCIEKDWPTDKEILGRDRFIVVVPNPVIFTRVVYGTRHRMKSRCSTSCWVERSEIP